MLISSYRPVALLGAWLGALSGGWFVVGSLLGPTWTRMGMTTGQPVGGTMLRTAEQLGFFTGLGIVVVFFATLTLGRLSVVSVRDTKLAEAKVARTGMRFPGLRRGRPAAESGKPASERVRSAAR